MSIMKSLGRNAGHMLSALALVATGSALADSFVWPPSGSVTITPEDSPAVIADADIANVSALSEITVQEGATVVFANTQEVKISAVLKGAGTISAASAGTVELAGSSPDFAGTFGFTNTVVTVSGANGLGKGANGAKAYCSKGAGGKLLFTGEGLVNETPLYAGDSTTATFQIGAKETGETWVQMADFYFVKCSNTQYGDICGNALFTNCTIKSVSSGSSINFRLSTAGTTARFASGVNVKAPSSSSFWLWGVGTYYFDTTNLSAQALAAQSSIGTKVAFGASDIFHEYTAALNLYTSYTSASPTGWVDLNGFDQTIGGIGHPNTFSEGDNKYAIVKSTVPATLTVKPSAKRLSAAKFSGELSVVFEGKATSTNRLLNVISDATGELRVSSGVVELAPGTGWRGSAVTVDGTGVLSVESDVALTTASAALAIADSGRLELVGGVSLFVDTLTIGGTELKSGRTYSVADLAGLGYGDFVTGSGSIEVAAHGTEWKGWPDDPGGSVSVPAGKTVYITDDDVYNVSRLGEIVLEPESVVICSNLTETLPLSAAVTGRGTFSAVNSDSVILLGDNSGIIEPGAFWFSNSVVVVSNRYGLGSSQSGTVVDYPGEKDTFLFGGAGLTNDVGIKIMQKFDGFGAQDVTETLVQNGSLAVLGGNSNRGSFRGSIVLNGTFSPSNSDSPWLLTTAPASFTFGEESRMSLSKWIYLNGCVFRIASTNLSASCMCGSSSVKVTFDVTNAFRSTVFASYFSTNPSGYYDLNGFDQAFMYMSHPNGSAPIEANGQYFVVKSEDPAMLSFDFAAFTTTCVLEAMFKGAAGFRNATAGTVRLVNRVSPTTGILQASSGTTTMEGGFGWQGLRVIVDGGLLSVTSTANAVPFSRKADVEVSNGGKIRLDEGVSAVVRALKFGDDYLPPGVYGSSAAAAAGLVSPAFVRDDIFDSAGKGIMRVRTGGGRGFLLLLR